MTSVQMTNILIIEEQRRRDRETPWEPIPLHAPTPRRPAPRPSNESESEPETGRGVIIIDISDYSETRL